MKRNCFIVCALMTLLFISCKKDDDNEVVDVEGYWTGWWSSGSSSTHNNMAVLFRPGSSVRVLYGYTSDTTTAAFKAEGSYTITGNTLRFSYNEATSTFIHKSTIASTMDGTWGTAPSETNGGYFEITKR